jgi:hypothetical protein
MTHEYHDDPYIQALEQGVPRQLARLRYDITSDAYDQLQEAFIFHWRYALQVAIHQFRNVVTLRCPGCGGRHLGTLEKPGLYCSYGWEHGVRYFFSQIYFSGLHGED